jgi:hypothetical protein
LIESIGYTEEGFVWMKIVFAKDNQQGSMIVQLSQDKAKEVSNVLMTAAIEAGEKYGVRNSSNTH